MEFRDFTFEEQFFNKPIYVTPLDLTQGGIVPNMEPVFNQPIQLNKPMLFKTSSKSQFVKNINKNWGWYLGFFIAGMVVGNDIINKSQEQQKKNVGFI
jgi:hypothetical protein